MNIEPLLEDEQLRIDVCETSLLAFMVCYLSRYIKFEFAPFHYEVEKDLMDDECLELLLWMFRESAKTAEVGLAFALWSICYQKRNFIIYGSEDESAASGNMSNLINALQTNKLLIHDFGMLYFEPQGIYQESKKKTVKDFITANDIRVLARGSGQKVRGLVHREHRPDLFIGDDLESILSVKTLEKRDKLTLWIGSEVKGGMNKVYGKTIILANSLHIDGQAPRLKKNKAWKTHKVPVVLDDGKLAWPSRWVHTEKEAIDFNIDLPREKKIVSVEGIKYREGSLIFNQDYMLVPVSAEEQIIKPEWIKHYSDKINHVDENRYRTVMHIDPAISEKEKADFSAMAVFAYDKLLDRAVCLDYFNVKASYQELKLLIHKRFLYWQPSVVGVEDVAAQNWLIQDLRNDYRLPVKGTKRKSDKRSRLISISYVFEQGKVFFRQNQQIMTNQITNFGSATHDDLVDVVIDCVEMLFRKGGTRLRKLNKHV